MAEVEAEGGEVGGESEDRREFDGGGCWTGSDGLLWAGSGVGLEQSFGELKGGSIRDPEVAGEEEGQEEWFERLLRDGAAAPLAACRRFSGQVGAVSGEEETEPSGGDPER